MPPSDSTSPFRLDGKVALVTGGSKGLGRAMLHALGDAGAKVVVNYCNGREKAEATYESLRAKGIECALIRADVTKEDEVDRLVTETEKALGPVDILVPNATCDQPHEPVTDYPLDFYRAMLDFFVMSPVMLARRCVPGMKARRWGRIINIGSEVFQLGVPNFSAYVAAKGGQNGLSRSLATELAPFGICVNMISPGWIPVERHDTEPQEWKDGYLPTIPVGRWGVPEDLNGTLLYLASDASAFVVGQNIVVNGGRTVA